MAGFRVVGSSIPTRSGYRPGASSRGTAIVFSYTASPGSQRRISASSGMTASPMASASVPGSVGKSQYPCPDSRGRRLFRLDERSSSAPTPCEGPPGVPRKCRRRSRAYVEVSDRSPTSLLHGQQTLRTLLRGGKRRHQLRTDNRLRQIAVHPRRQKSFLVSLHRMSGSAMIRR